MPKKRRTKPQSGSDIKTVIIKALTGSLVGVIIFFVLTALASLILWKTDSDVGVYKPVILAVGAIASFVCGFVAVRPTRKNGIVVGALSALPVYFIEAVVGILLSERGVGLIGWILLAVEIIFSSIGGIIAVNKRK